LAKDEIRNLLANSKKVLEQEYTNSENSIKEDLKTFKKKTLDQI